MDASPRSAEPTSVRTDHAVDAGWPEGTTFAVFQRADDWGPRMERYRTPRLSAALAVASPWDVVHAEHPALLAPLAFVPGCEAEVLALLALKVEAAARVAQTTD